jgi:hypothetical protein
MVFHPQDDRPHRIEGAPAEEDLSEADVVERLDLDPSEQQNYTEDESVRDARTDAGPDEDLDALEYDEA